MIVVALLDRPYSHWPGNVAPTEMQRTLSFVDHGQPAPCDEHGARKS
jgi:hypothetical protein